MNRTVRLTADGNPTAHILIPVFFLLFSIEYVLFIDLSTYSTIGILIEVAILFINKFSDT